MKKELEIEVAKQKYGDHAIEHFQLLAKDNVALSVTHLCGNKGGQPIVLLHGSYSTRHFWISQKGIGLGAYLTDHGFDIWVPEFRGHGFSPKGKHFKRYSVEQQMKFDLPAFSEFIFHKTKQAAVWFGHSLGGLSLYGSISQGWLQTQYIKGLITMGSQVSEGDRYLKIPFVPFLADRLLDIFGEFPAKKLGLGPENEAPGVIRDVISWKKRGGNWSSSDGISFWDGFSKIKQPCLVIASRGDTTDSFEGCEYLFNQLGSKSKQFILLGVEEGYAKDYDHVGMVIDKSAQQEVWPLILSWLK